MWFEIVTGLDQAPSVGDFAGIVAFGALAPEAEGIGIAETADRATDAADAELAIEALVGSSEREDRGDR